MEKIKKNFIKIFIILYIEILRWWRNKFKVFTTVTQPFIWTIFFGIGLGKIIDVKEIASILNYSGPINYLLFIFPGMIGTTVIFVSFSFGHSFVEEKEKGFLKPIILSPTPTWIIILGKILASGIVGALQGLLVNILSFIYFKDVAVTILTFPVLIILGILSGAIGIFFAIFFKNIGSYDSLLFFLVIPAILLSGAYFPIELTPIWMIKISQFNPFYYGIEMVKKVFFASLSLEKDLSNLKEILATKGFGVLETIFFNLFFIILFITLISVIIKHKSLE
jgi:ABC-2 type transport system permease protein